MGRERPRCRVDGLVSSTRAATQRVRELLELALLLLLTIARRREAVLAPGSSNVLGKPHLGDEINSLFDVFLLARLIVAGRRSGPLAARRRVLGSKDLTRVIAGFLARKLLPPDYFHVERDDESDDENDDESDSDDDSDDSDDDSDSS